VAWQQNQRPIVITQSYVKIINRPGLPGEIALSGIGKSLEESIRLDFGAL